MDLTTVINRTPTFYTIVKSEKTARVKPECLKTGVKLFRTADELLRAVHSIWDNCYIYNGLLHPVSHVAQKVQKEFSRALEDAVEKGWWTQDDVHRAATSTEEDRLRAMTDAAKAKYRAQVHQTQTTDPPVSSALQTPPAAPKRIRLKPSGTSNTPKITTVPPPQPTSIHHTPPPSPPTQSPHRSPIHPQPSQPTEAPGREALTEVSPVVVHIPSVSSVVPMRADPPPKSPKISDTPSLTAVTDASLSHHVTAKSHPVIQKPHHFSLHANSSKKIPLMTARPVPSPTQKLIKEEKLEIVAKIEGLTEAEMEAFENFMESLRKDDPQWATESDTITFNFEDFETSELRKIQTYLTLR
ncbi:hypothetical protein BLNAU_2553 [Blattamonas nauphoetae]|uniref:Bromo domain-containing protein n=1 Tax=Blattamonas nauphoetae TaxID=2049346 RepID=A0ABQ9YF14_9EUKA|nr:hypothetical protein BLNAU_2553 [Blattamonas nauphoetae]